MQVRTRTLAAVAVAAIVVASGCLTVTVDSTVNNDGTVSEYQLTMEMPQQFYSQLEASAQEQDMTVAESIKSNYTQEYYGSVNVETEQLEDEQKARITITLQDFDPNDFEGSDFSGGQGESTPAPEDQSSDPQIDVTVEEDRIIYVDDSFNAPTNGSGEGGGGGGDFGAGFSLEYSVTMPGKIIESETNADEIDGRTATWSRNGTNVFSNTEIRAVSERSSGGGGGLGLPGFGAGVAVVALLLAAGAMAARTRRD